VSDRPIAVAALGLRQRAVVVGEIQSVASFERPWVRTDAVLADRTGELILRFMGRATVPGLVAGRRVIAQGTPGVVRDAVVMLNPLYSFVTCKWASGASW
jgi:hypothetical protein